MKEKQYYNSSDAELLELYNVDNDQKWIGILLERYTLLLFGVCMKYLKDENEAKDGVQQVFLKVLTEVSKYRIEYFKSWLYMVAKNHCLMRLREKDGKETKELEDKYLSSDTYDVGLEKEFYIATSEIAHEFLEESINELSTEQRQCVILFYLKKNTYHQISERTGFNSMQVKSYIQNGKRNLKIILERKIKNGKLKKP